MKNIFLLFLLFLHGKSGFCVVPQERSPRFRTMRELHEALSQLEKETLKLQQRREKIGERFVSLPAICEGRLTTESGVAISTSNRTAQATLYFTPYLGTTIALYDGSTWENFTFTEKSLALSGLTSGKNYDVFLYNNAGTLTLELSAAWTNDTTRADALTTQDGVYVKNGATTRRHLGTIRATGATTTEDSSAKRFVWNRCNQVTRFLLVKEAADSWSYTGDAWQAANGDTANKVEYVSGQADVLVMASTLMLAKSSSGVVNYVSSGVGVDSATTNSTSLRGSAVDSGAISQVWGFYEGYPGLGYHYLQWIERGHSATAVTIYGDNGDATKYQSGLLAHFSG